MSNSINAGIDFSIHKNPDDDKKITLYRKSNGFSGDVLLKMTKEVNDRKETAITDKLDALKKSRADLFEANKKIAELQGLVKSLSSPFRQLSVSQDDYFGSRLGVATSSNPSVAADLIADITPQSQCPVGELDIEVRRIATRDNITTTTAIVGTETSVGNNFTKIYVKGQAISCKR